MSPEQFSTIASAWIGSLAVVLSALAFALYKLLPIIKDLRDKYSELFTLHKTNATAIEINREDIANQQSQITYVAAQSTPK